MSNFTDYRDHVGARADKHYKATLFQSARLLLGLNCLEPGQTQHVHTHDDQDKFYVGLEGEGDFIVGEETRRVGTGITVGAPAGVYHGVTNPGTTRLVGRMGISPAP